MPAAVDFAAGMSQLRGMDLTTDTAPGVFDLHPTAAVPARPTARPIRHAVVIGSGFGGLAAAVRLGARGYRVTLLEKLDAPGGRAYVHHQDGFTFDAGPTILTAPFLFEDLWKLCGRRLADDVELRALGEFYQIRFDDGETFHYSGDPDAMRAEVARLSTGRRGRLRALPGG